MKKYLLLSTILFTSIFLFAQSETLINENGVTLGYSATKYNSQTIDNVNYDQYEVTIYFKNNKGTYIYAPVGCTVSFQNALEQPKSLGINFGWSGAYYGGVRSGYQEYNDHTAISLDLDEPVKDKGFTQSRVIKPGHKQECIKYIFTKQGEPLPSPRYKIDFRDNRVDVNATNAVVETWIERGSNRITPKNGYRGGFEIPFAFYPNNNNGRPIGNRGDVVAEISTIDLRNSLTKSIDEKKKLFKQFFIQNGYKFQSEGNQTLKICADDPPVESYNGYCLTFIGFKICFTNDGKTVFYTNINESKEIGLKAFELIEDFGGGGDGGCEFGSVIFLK